MSNGKAKATGTEGEPAVTAPQPKTAPPPGSSTPPLFRPIDWIAFAAITLLVWIGYYLTLAPNLTLEDSGELAVGSFYAGIPHPPGYPIWTLYTWLWTVLLPIHNVAWRVALGEATAGAFSCGLLGLLVSRGSSMMMEGIAELKNIDRRWENAICIVSGFVAGMLLGFNGFMWSQSVIVEVYSFSVLSLMCVMLCLLRWVYAPAQTRYLALSFFLFGICFNNHQSLLVIAMGMEALVLFVHRKLARALLFWNSVLFLAGLLLVKMNMMSVLTSNTPIFVIFVVIGIASLAIWLWLALATKLRGLELLRDLALVSSLGYLGGLLLIITHYIGVFDNSKGGLALFNLIGIGAIVAFVWLAKATKSLPKEWLAALNCGGAWIAGTAFYLYMPLAGMTNPPMQWGYPRTVEGFFHAFTRGQYEKIHPTSGTGAHLPEIVVSFCKIYARQMWMYIEGVNDEFNLVYILVALVMFLFYRRMQARERAWTLGVTAIFICLGPFLVLLLNPGMDRQSVELNRVFFTASHVMIAMAVGYGLTLIAASMATQYQKLRSWFWMGGSVAVAFAFIYLVLATQTIFGEPPDMNVFGLFFHALGNFFPALAKAFARDQYALPVFAAIILLGMALVYTACVLLCRTKAPMAITLAMFAAMPFYSVMNHWSDNEQRGHLFGYWFGHDMFTPPFGIYPEMSRDAVLYGGTDPGRFCPTYMIFCESFIPPDCKKETDPKFDRRDVYIITQNALADGTYLNYIRAHYNRSTQHDPYFFQELLRSPKEREENYDTNFLARIAGSLLDKPLTRLGAGIEARRRREGVYPHNEIYIASPDDSQRCFQEYLADAQVRLQSNQLKPGEDVKIVDNKVQVSGQTAVMAINGLLTKVMFDHNPTNEFYVEESFPLEWMYPHLTPFGIIMKINRQPLPALTEDIYQKDHEFWSRFSERLIGTNVVTYDTSVEDIAKFVEKVYLRRDYSGFKGDRKFIRDDQAQKAFSKLRSSIAGVYAWRVGQFPPERRQSPEFQRLFKEADFAFRQAFAFCPYSPEAVFRYANLLVGQPNRLNDALLVAETAVKLDPANGQMVLLVENLRGFKKQFAERDQMQANLVHMEEEVRKNPTNYQNAFNLASIYLQMQQTNRAILILDGVVNLPHVEPAALLSVAQAYQMMGNSAKLEATLEKLVTVIPEEPEPWYDLASLKVNIGKNADALAALSRALDLSARRLAKNPGASNLLLLARSDARLNALRSLPEFQKLVPPQ